MMTWVSWVSLGLAVVALIAFLRLRKAHFYFRVELGRSFAVEVGEPLPVVFAGLRAAEEAIDRGLSSCGLRLDVAALQRARGAPPLPAPDACPCESGKPFADCHGLSDAEVR